MPALPVADPVEYLHNSVADFERQCASEELIARIYNLLPSVKWWVQRGAAAEVVCDFIDTSIGAILIGCPEPGWGKEPLEICESEIFAPWEL